MIVDADCHISSRSDPSLPWITGDELVERLDRAGCDRAIVWLSPPYDRNIEPENEAVYQACRKHPDRFIGFGWANPRLGKERTEAAIKRCFEEYGFHGIKFNGAQDGYVIDDAHVSLPYLEFAARYGKVLAFHIGADFYENTHPFRLGNVAAALPETKLMASHMGGAALPSLHRACIETAQKYPNIYLIGSTVPETEVLKAIRTVGPQRVCFGSDEPYRRVDYHLAGYRAMLAGDPELSDRDRADVLGLNIMRLVGLS